MTHAGTSIRNHSPPRRRIGVLELVADAPARSRVDYLYGAAMRKQYASVMPQVISVWCRQLGHEVHYATFWGQPDPSALLPDDLDLVFVSSYTQASALAYALAKTYRKKRVLTVFGGPHARSFPFDALRFFDIVVRNCDRELIEQIVGGAIPPGSLITSARPMRSFPTVEERLPEIETASFYRGRPRAFTWISMLTSVGCPYTCSFCVDWNSTYAFLPPDQLRADLEYVSQRFPGTIIAYHDPNFGVKFDETLAAIERVDEERRNPYIMESSLALLKGSRIARLQASGCAFVAPGVESWADHSGKIGVGRSEGRDKLDRVVNHFEALFEHIPGLQANFIFGSDLDRGDEPVELTREFVRRTPYVWPTVNIPIPFGGTPLYDGLLEQGRVLRTMPFAFYYNPHLVSTLLHYDPISYYERLLQIFAEMTSARMLARRLALSLPWVLRAYFVLRTAAMRVYIREYRRLLALMKRDLSFAAFHRGATNELPAYYHRRLEQKLGPFASLLSHADRTPELSQPQSSADYLSA